MTAVSLKNFTDVMKQTAQPHDINVCSDFLSDMNANFCLFKRMNQQILAVGSSKFHSSKKWIEIRRQTVDIYFVGKFFSFLKHYFFQFFPGLRNNFFNAERLHAGIFE